MISNVNSVKPLQDFKLLVQFETGESRKFDVEPLLDFPVNQRLRKVDYLSSARVENGTVVWDEQCHLSPDSIYLQGEPV